MSDGFIPLLCLFFNALTASDEMKNGCFVGLFRQLHECLAQLVTEHLNVKRWLFKLDNEFDGRGIAYCDVTDHLKCFRWAQKEAKRYGDKWNKKWAQASLGWGMGGDGVGMGWDGGWVGLGWEWGWEVGDLVLVCQWIDSLVRRWRIYMGLGAVEGVSHGMSDSV